MAKEITTNGDTSRIERVFLPDSSSTTGAGLIGLDETSSGLIISTIADNEATPTVYTQSGSTIEDVTGTGTLGTYEAPTSTKCRFEEIDATNHPGLYEIQLADARYAVASSEKLIVTISGATNLAPTFMELQLGVDTNVATWLDTAPLGLDFQRVRTVLADNASSAALDDETVQTISRLIQGRDGDIVYVSTGGNDSNSAPFSWETAKLTVASALTAASAGDLVLVGPGTFSTSSQINIKADVEVRGVGRTLTILEITQDSTTLAGIRLNDRSVLRNCRVQQDDPATSTNRVKGIGCDSGDAAFVDGLVEDCDVDLSWDGFLLGKTGARSTLTVRNCSIRTAFDCVANNLSDNDSYIRLENCFIEADGGRYPSVASVGANGTAYRCQSGLLYVTNCHARVFGFSTTNLGISVSGTGDKVFLQGGSIWTNGTSNADMLIGSGAEVRISGCAYDETSISNSGTLLIGPQALDLRQPLDLTPVVDTSGEALFHATRALNPSDELTLAAIKTQSTDALSDIFLDKLFASAGADEAVDDSYWADLVSATSDASSFNPALHSLEALRVRGDAAWATSVATSTLTIAQVATEISDAFSVDTVTLPGQGAPPLAPTHEEMISWMYKVMRNRKDQSATTWQLYADDESTVDAKATVSDAASVATKQEIVSGP